LKIPKVTSEKKKQVVHNYPTPTDIKIIPWVDKYAPKNSAEIIGNKDIVKQLGDWIRDWDNVNIKGIKKDFSYKKGGGKWDDTPNPNARACLLSGPPGIGKTSAAKVISKELGFEILETNASDQRNKKSVEELLYYPSLWKMNLLFFMQKKESNNQVQRKPLLIIMDEIDGVNGIQDRNGIPALIKIIKNAKVPVICICNDRQNPKVRSIASHCYDLKFAKPGKNEIKTRLKYILNAEKGCMDDLALDLLIESSGSDIRQIINTMQIHRKGFEKKLTYNETKKKYLY